MTDTSEENMAKVVNAERYEKLRRFFCSRDHCTYLGGKQGVSRDRADAQSEEAKGVML